MESQNTVAIEARMYDEAAIPIAEGRPARARGVLANIHADLLSAGAAVIVFAGLLWWLLATLNPVR